ncbi:MAG: peptide MFS transporter [Elusimicrobiaceae bacterium]|nr:peptide MFS transporter [Elusimicrobiaceae bacterium]
MQQITEKQKQPAGLYLLFATEMWERFSFYSLKALFILYLTKELLLSKEVASGYFGTLMSLIFLSPLIGGYIADKWIGKRASIIIGALCIIAGQLCMGQGSLHAVFVAMGLIVAGNGFFKPNISSIVGDLYEKNDPRRDSGFTIFYMGINLGSFLAGLIAGTLAAKYGWAYGFGSAAVGMLFGLVLFVWGKDKYLQGKGKAPKYYVKTTKTKQEVSNAPLTKEEKQRIAVIFIMAFFSVFFWAIFEQKGAALNLIADEHVNRVINFFGKPFEIPTAWFQSVNPLFIMLFAPVFSKLWVFLGKKGKDLSVPAKFMVAFWLIALGYVILLTATSVCGDNKMGIFWIIGAYFMFTMGELCLSPVGLSMVTKLSPVKFISLFMGIWFLANSAAGFLAGKYSGKLDTMTLQQFFTWPVITAFGASIILLVLIKPINKWMHGVK